METQITPQDFSPQVIDNLSGFLSFQYNFLLWALSDCDAQTILLVSGNQAGKSASIVKNYILRIMGIHPIEKKNMRPDTKCRIFRFGAQTLPLEASEGESRNTIYPHFKRFLPPSSIKKDITTRKPVVTIQDIQGGKDIFVEFVSYGQDLQTQAGVQRISIFLDEESPYSFYEEQLPRLLASNGDLIIGATPISKLTWLYEEIYQKAKIIYNSPHIIDYLKKRDGVTHPIKEYTDSKLDIAVIRAATDDNPTLVKESIDQRYGSLDLSTLETRRYGIFHQVTGVVYKQYDPIIHFISRDKYFPKGMPHDWLHARGIDFHEHNNWACGFICLSLQNEAFIYNEFNPSPDRMVTEEIGKELAILSKDYRYTINLLDPRAAIKQANTRLSALDVLNKSFLESSQQNIGTGGYWQTWDTKSSVGRDIINKRLSNSKKVGKPFNNEIHENGIIRYLPTLWVLDNCTETNYSFKNWKWQQWASEDKRRTDDEKEKPEVRFSHFPVTFECIFKHYAFDPIHFSGRKREERIGQKNYFKRRI